MRLISILAGREHLLVLRLNISQMRPKLELYESMREDGAVE